MSRADCVYSSGVIVAIPRLWSALSSTPSSVTMSNNSGSALGSKSCKKFINIFLQGFATKMCVCLVLCCVCFTNTLPQASHYTLQDSLFFFSLNCSNTKQVFAGLNEDTQHIMRCIYVMFLFLTELNKI